MPFVIEYTTPFTEILKITCQPFQDSRGIFLELSKQNVFSSFNIPNFVQDNLAYSNKDVLRGLHFQKTPHEQGKFVFPILGQIFDVAVDIRKNSQTFGQWFGITLKQKDFTGIYIPPGFAHGYCVLKSPCLVLYKTTLEYTPSAEESIRWDDPTIAIRWPIKQPILSEKDKTAPLLIDLKCLRQG